MPHRGRVPAFAGAVGIWLGRARHRGRIMESGFFFMNLSPLYLDPKKLLNIAGRRVSNFLQGYAFYACNGFSD